MKAGSHVLLCVTGGIAAYKAASLASALVQGGAVVDVMMTAEAERFVGPLTFSALTARPVYSSLWDAPERIPHVRLVREAQAAVVAPATANVIAKLAHGIADDLVTTALLAARIPVVLAPAMNDAMYRSEATQANLRALRERGYDVVEPGVGFLAERESGIGRLAEESALLGAIEVALARTRALEGLRVAITAGPTREAFDPVRFVSNPSTGATGIALAREMYDAAIERAVGADVIVAAAAVADWRPADASERKVKKTEADLNVRMVRNPDVLAELGRRKGETFLLGFAAETEDHEANAREKLARKNLDAIAVNDVSGARGFGAQENALVVLWGGGGRRELGTARKEVLAARLLDCVQERMQARHARSGAEEDECC
ncbi:MAG: bifunctional phosphopantothenoylcysteine decarboxylase/phosphopantothenate--cysteine ligase CoaBC [Vulcanimicrobiaceae bacterium]